MTIPSKSICIGLFMLASTACWNWNPFERNADMVQIGGPDAWHSLVVYFKAGTTSAQVEAFNHNVLKNPPDERGADFKEGIGSYLRLSPEQANGHWGFAITFYKKATEEQRAKIKESITSNELVFKVFENIAPKDIKESDLK